MGSYLTRVLDSFAQMKVKILMLGLDGAGKTTILYQMKMNQMVTSVPTIGFNVEEVNYKGLHFTVWDIGGQTRLRGLWHHYYENTNALIYVLDCSDAQRLDLAKQTLRQVMTHEKMNDCPMLIFANKMDISPYRPDEIVEKLGLHLVRKIWHLQPCCGLNGEGIVQGFDWLRKQMKKGKSK